MYDEIKKKKKAFTMDREHCQISTKGSVNTAS